VGQQQRVLLCERVWALFDPGSIAQKRARLLHLARQAVDAEFVLNLALKLETCRGTVSVSRGSSYLARRSNEGHEMQDKLGVKRADATF
jgi:hypothetical protein